MYEEYIIFGSTVVIAALIWYYFIRSLAEAEKNVTTCPDENCVRCRRGDDDVLAWAAAKCDEPIETQADNTDRSRLMSISAAVNNTKTVISELSSNQQPTVFCLPHLTTKPFYDIKELSSHVQDSLNTLKANSDKLWTAYKLAKADYPRGWHLNSTTSGRWELFSLVNQGSVTKTSLSICPDLMAMLADMKYNTWTDNLFGFVAFSEVHPGTHISTHTGPSNTRIRAHLPLQVPDSDKTKCVLSVDGVTRPWSLGSYLIFDDSYPHSVHYEHSGKIGSSSRIVLMLDLWHPQLTDMEKQILNQIFPPLTDKVSLSAKKKQ